MIGCNPKPSLVSRQCLLPWLARSAAYHTPREVSREDLDWFSRRLLTRRYFACTTDDLYNARRPHRSFDGNTPDATHLAALAAATRPAREAMK